MQPFHEHWTIYDTGQKVEIQKQQPLWQEDLIASTTKTEIYKEHISACQI